MTVLELAKKHNLEVVINANAEERTINGGYSGDLLSVVMANAKENNVWLTVMGNVNAVAVAVLTDCSCILLTQNAELDDVAKLRAETQEIPILRTDKSTFDASILIASDLA